MKKVNAIGFLSLCFMVAILVVKAGSPVRLCGRDFVRVVIRTCGEVHTKRQVWTDYSWDHTANSEDRLNFQDLDESQNLNVIPAEAKANQALQDAGRRSAERRHDTASLHAKCCTDGCLTADIRSLC